MISPAVIRERDTLQMTCEVPQSQSASLCLFYPDGIEALPYSHPACQISLTGVQLLQWTRQSSPLEAKVGCYYTVTSPGQQIQQSAHSDLVSVTVLGEHPHSLVLIYQLMFQYVTTDDIYSFSCYDIGAFLRDLKTGQKIFDKCLFSQHRQTAEATHNGPSRWLHLHCL